MLESKLNNILDLADENESKIEYLDFFPKTFQADNDKFDEFETFMQEEYYDEYSKKMAWIILGLVSYYQSEIYLEDVDYEDSTLNNLRHKNLLDYLEYSEISKIIRRFCQNEETGLKIALIAENNLALVLYEGGMRLSFYDLTDDQKEVASNLVISQGFYFKEAK
ncbi:hypothetical protein [uncultured Lactobacillus sp.]|uniref:hypothetical protein n=1 Tax=uncultured Lactobacillus sp. TaxID=153152 RepID=UPI0026385035|nr:hypothetical protein [uncultured Lactobacillus sp.]